MISYEVSLGLILVSLVLITHSLNLSEIVAWQEDIWFIIPFFPLFVLFLISGFAETSRPPFDLPEAEGELVAGYNVEYSSVSFALFFIGEYANIILFSTMIVIYFLGGWNIGIVSFSIFNMLFENVYALNEIYSIIQSFVFILKINIILFIFIWVRAAFPRYRYDQLMSIGWKLFLPISLGYIFLTTGMLYLFNII